MMDENDLMSAYSLDVRIIQKKDQLEELSAIGGAISAPVVEEVRTGQQFLIKLHLSRNGVAHTSRLPSLRVSRRVAINTTGESRTEPEPLTLEIAVHLAKSGQVRKGACAKCCHKYGPSSPILLLLDPFSPSALDPAAYAHVDTTTGSITMLAKVVCSSTDHGERGNKDRYVFEFKLKRPSHGITTTQSNCNGSSSMDSPEDDGEIIATCFTPPIMASGHHKAKRMYPHPRPSKVAKGGPTPKTKIIKRHKSEPNIMTPFQGPADGSMVDHSGFASTMPFLTEPLSHVPMMGSYSNHSTDANMQPHSTNSSQHSGGYMSALPHPSAPMQPPHPSQPFPRITAVRPDHGPIRKTTDVVLRGGFFREGMVPYFGCFPALDVIVETPNLIVCKAPESPLPGAVSITIYDSMGNSFADLGQFTYTDDAETELLILKLQLRLAHRALEYLHTQATGRKGNAVDILKDIPGLSTSPRSGSLLMDDAPEPRGTNAEAQEITLELMRDPVEQGVLDMLDQVPYGMDISLQLEDGSNLLHLSLLLGFDRLTERLIEEGCDVEVQDAWSMTPLMYAVLKGNERMTRALVLAGASSSGARTPQEFYSSLPWIIEPSSTIVSHLTISCSRYSVTARSFSLEPVEEELEQDGMDDEGRSSLSASSDDDLDSDSTQTITRRSTERRDSEETVATVDVGYPRVFESWSEMMTRLADALQGMHTYHGMPPLDQQGLPPFQTVESDGSITINNKVIKTNAAEGLGAEIYTHVHPESGYHSGVVSEVQKRLNRLHMATLPSEGVQMTVLLKKLSPTSSVPSSSSSSSSSSVSRSTPLELFRTGDSFHIEIRLAIEPSLVENGEQALLLPMPKEYVGIRFPNEMVKRVSGRPAYILSEMTYSLRMTMELGRTERCCKKSAVSGTEEGVTAAERDYEEEEENDGEPLEEEKEEESTGLLTGACCQACSKYLHEHRKLSPSRRSIQDPWKYPILQFSVPGGSSVSASTQQRPQQQQQQQQQQPQHPELSSNTSGHTSSNNADQSGVVELRDGVCEVKAKVNCSSMHHLIQRERAKRATALKQRKQEGQRPVTDQGSSSSCLASEPSPTLFSPTSQSVSESAESAESAASAESEEGSESSSAGLPLPSRRTKRRAMTELQDPGFVFNFELIHPTLNTVVAQYHTQPILFQTYARGRV
ncbi:SPT3 Dosage dependent suppressor of Ty-induced promoter mutations-like protein [Mortierella alpina]|nr:SPT3 Dosage dependent suppressor of Ty-induced promoter mutations-like protein [Mortierella alpina]